MAELWLGPELSDRRSRGPDSCRENPLGRSSQSSWGAGRAEEAGWTTPPAKAMGLGVPVLFVRCPSRVTSFFCFNTGAAPIFHVGSGAECVWG